MRRVLIAAVASSLLTGAAIAATSIAQSGDDEKAKPPSTMAQALERHEAERDKRLSAVAKRLDVPAGDLKDAIEKVRAAQLDQAVRDGRLTDAQRDAIRACKDKPLTCDRSNLPAPRIHRRELRRGGGERPELREMRREMRAKRDAFFAAVAKELGKETADVRRAFQAERPRGAWRVHRRGPGPEPAMVPAGPGGPGGPELAGP